MQPPNEYTTAMRRSASTKRIKATHSEIVRIYKCEKYVLTAGEISLKMAHKFVCRCL